MLDYFQEKPAVAARRWFGLGVPIVVRVFIRIVIWLVAAILSLVALSGALGLVLGPVFALLLTAVSGGEATLSLADYQTAFEPLLYGVVIAIVATFLLKETGTAVARTPAAGVSHDPRIRNGKVRTAVGQMSKP